ncbi:NAD(P)/FAD-dependent oxidoreductase [Lentzea sp. NPDC004789]
MGHAVGDRRVRRVRPPAGQSVLSSDVAVVGAGIVGALTAWRLQAAGHRVVLLSPRWLGGTTAASAAVIRTVCDEPELAADSLAWYGRWSDRATPALTALVRCGVVVVTPPEAVDSANRASRLVAGRDSAATPRRCDPSAVPAGYRPGAGVAWYEPISGCADPRVMVLSIIRAFLRAGGSLRQARVRSVNRTRGSWTLLTDGPAARAAVVLLAAGADTPTLLPDPATRRQVHRQPVSMGAFDGHTAAMPAFVDLANGLLLRPFPGGILGTLRTDHRGQRFLDALQVAAGTRLSRLATTRPRLVTESEFDITADGQPFIGQVDHGLFVAYGLGGRGFKWAPALTEAIAAAMTTGRTRESLLRFDPLRTQAATAGPLAALS